VAAIPWCASTDSRSRSSTKPARKYCRSSFSPEEVVAPVGGGARRQIQGCAQRRLWLPALRVSEVVSLKMSDIDSKRMMLPCGARQGRQGSPRDALAAFAGAFARLVADRAATSLAVSWLDPINPMSTRQLNRACHAAAHMAEITKRVTPHTLRHSLQRTCLSRTSISCDPGSVGTRQARYDRALHARCHNIIRDVMSPLDRLTPAAVWRRQAARIKPNLRGAACSGSRGYLP